jgi:hypothetical protein
LSNYSHSPVFANGPREWYENALKNGLRKLSPQIDVYQEIEANPAMNFVASNQIALYEKDDFPGCHSPDRNRFFRTEQRS